MTCEICAGVVYLCPICHEPISEHSRENDFIICKTYSFVNPIREHDGARINGDGQQTELRATAAPVQKETV